MDTSKMSVAEALYEFEKILRIHMKSLPFSRMCDVLDIGKMTIENSNYHLRVCGTRGPLGMDEHRDMMLIIPINTQTFFNEEKVLRSLKINRLIFKRTNGPDEWGAWGVHKAEFVQTTPDTIKNQFHSRVSEIIMCPMCSGTTQLNHVLGEFYFPDDFVETVKQTLVHWIRESRFKRLETVFAFERLEETLLS